MDSKCAPKAEVSEPHVAVELPTDSEGAPLACGLRFIVLDGHHAWRRDDRGFRKWPAGAEVVH
jgi:hypothetical protein